MFFLLHNRTFSFSKINLENMHFGKKKTAYQLKQVATRRFPSETRGFLSPSHDGFGLINYYQLSADVIRTVLSVLSFLWSGRGNRTLTDLRLCPAL